MLVVPPLLVALVFAGYVWWRQTADLTASSSSSSPGRSSGPSLGQHARLTFVASALVVLIAVPLGIALTRGRCAGFSPLVVAHRQRRPGARPSVGLIVLLAIWLGYGFWTAIIALTLYGLLPVLRNTITGLDGVDPTLVEAGRGLGHVAGVGAAARRAAAGPAGDHGRRAHRARAGRRHRDPGDVHRRAAGSARSSTTGITLPARLMVAGAVLVALLALLIEWLGRVLELLTRPKGI